MTTAQHGWLGMLGALVCAVVAAGACTTSGSGGGPVDGGLGGAGGGAASGGGGGVLTGGTGGQGDAAACKVDGQICAAFGECCSGTCTQGRCGGVACVADNGACTVFGDCCNGSCVQGACGGGGAGGADAGPPYPTGPIGINVGDVIENTTFDGVDNSQPAQSKLISLGEYYNPSDAVQKSRLLVLSLMTMWAAPASAQTQQADYAHWQGSRVEFLSVFSDGPNSGVAATELDLKNWDANFAVPHALALDPNFSKLGALFAAGGQAVPFNVYIDTRTMKILHQQAGAQVFDASNALLNGLLGL